MDLTDLQVALVVVIILSAIATAIVFVYLREQRRTRRAATYKTGRTQQAKLKARRLAAEWPPRTLVAVPIDSLPAAQPLAKREFVTVEVAPSSPAAPSPRAETPLPGSDAGLSSVSITIRPGATRSDRSDGLAVLPTREAPATARPIALSPATLPPVTIDSALWERMTSSQSAPSQSLPAVSFRSDSVATLQPTLAMIRDNLPVQEKSEMISQPALERVFESKRPLTGVVVSISMNHSVSKISEGCAVMESVVSYLTTLLRDNDFCYRTGNNEFVLVCLEEPGGPSQRRLNYISERLWDYKLRDIGTSSIPLSWDGIQVHNQPLGEAIASAAERMRETKRTGQSAQLVLACREAI